MNVNNWLKSNADQISIARLSNNNNNLEHVMLKTLIVQGNQLKNVKKTHTVKQLNLAPKRIWRIAVKLVLQIAGNNLSVFYSKLENVKIDPFRVTKFLIETDVSWIESAPGSMEKCLLAQIGMTVNLMTALNVKISLPNARRALTTNQEFVF